jgi:nucleoside-diphosphate-sugar epimerase
MSTVLVTGCNGYIGRHLVAALLERGHTVNGIDRRPGQLSLSRFDQADLNDKSRALKAVQGADTIFHLAAAKDDWGISAAEYGLDNTHATSNLINAGIQAGVSDWVFFSTVSVYGPSDVAIDETTAHRPNHPYGTSKANAESLFSRYAAEPGRRVLIIRPSVVFGPEHPTSTNVSRLIELNRRRRFVMVGSGAALKATSYIDNLVAATMFLLDHRSPGLVAYNYTDLPLLSAGDLVEGIRRRLDKRGLRLRVPLALGMPIGALGTALSAATGRNMPITADRIRKFNTGTAFSSAKIRALGFQQPVTLEEALDRTVAWHLSNR